MLLKHLIEIINNFVIHEVQLRFETQFLCKYTNNNFDIIAENYNLQVSMEKESA